jgi:predicted Zn-dependent protease
MDDIKSSLIWKIVPSGPPPRLKDIGEIVYGRVPSTFVQEVPKNEEYPPSLIEGGVYSITVVTRGDNHPSVIFSIRNGKVVKLRDEDERRKQSKVTSYTATDVSKLTPRGRVHFVPMSYSDVTLKELKDYYRQKYGLQIQIEPEIETDFDRTYDVQRGQHVAEEFISILRGKYPTTGREVYIGFEPQDMYVRRESWQFTYYFTSGSYAIVSDGRIGAFSDAKALTRFRKIVTRTIGILYYKLPLSDDHRSVMFKGLRGPDDLDRMTEDY